MYNLEATIQKLESEITDDPSRQAFLQALKARLAERIQSETAGLVGITRITTEKFADSGDSGESALQPQSLAAESHVRLDSAESAPTVPGDSTDVPENARNFAAALDKLEPGLREIASDLYEHLHFKSKFARLTSEQREAIVELLRHHTCERVAQVIAQPPPIGMSLRTSKAGVVRFREDYLRCAMHEAKQKSQAEAEARRLAEEEAFKKTNSSDAAFVQDTVQQIRKRLYQAAHNPDSDYHAIRWLIKSLHMLRET